MTGTDLGLLTRNMHVLVNTILTLFSPITKSFLSIRIINAGPSSHPSKVNRSLYRTIVRCIERLFDGKNARLSRSQGTQPLLPQPLRGISSPPGRSESKGQPQHCETVLRRIHNARINNRDTKGKPSHLQGQPRRARLSPLED